MSRVLALKIMYSGPIETQGLEDHFEKRIHRKKSLDFWIDEGM